MILMWLGGKIDGDCEVSGYEKWVTCESASFGGSKSVEKVESKVSSGVKHERTGRGDFQDLRVSKTTDIATPYLMFLAMKSRTPDLQGSGGQDSVISRLEIHFVEPIGDSSAKGFNPMTGAKSDYMPYVRIVFDQALLKEWGIDGDEGRPKEELTFHFAGVFLTYFPLGYLHPTWTKGLKSATQNQPVTKGWHPMKDPKEWSESHKGAPS